MLYALLAAGLTRVKAVGGSGTLANVVDVGLSDYSTSTSSGAVLSTGATTRTTPVGVIGY